MRIAVYFSGRIKGYEDCLDSLLELKRLYEPIFFCSLNEPTMTPYIQTFFDKLEIGPDQYILEPTPYPDWLDPANFILAIEACHIDENGKQHIDLRKVPKYFKFLNVDQHRVYSTYYHNKSAFNLIIEYMRKHSFNFDLVVKSRADIISQPLDFYIPQYNTLYIPGGGDCNGFGINDQYAYGDIESMYLYSILVDKLYQYSEEKLMYHPEHLLKQWLRSIRINIERFNHDIVLTPKRHL